MGMRIGSSNSTWSSNNTSAVQNTQQRQQGLKDLFSALKTGDLNGAQQAYAVVAKVTKIDSNSVLGQLGQALQKGDVEGAKALSASMQKHQVNRSALAPNTSSLSLMQSFGSKVDALA